ncbi:MAG: DNA recombination protein RmuC [Odoribacter sp.]|nr:DNA recombination protein RmuC [Odoribacter sp.]
MIIIMILMSVALIAAIIAVIFLLRRCNLAAEEKTALVTRLAVAEQRLEDERAMSGDRFRSLASDVLMANSSSLESNARLGLEAVLAPVREAIENFTRDFKACYDVERGDRAALRNGVEALAQLNRRIGDETARLTQALKGDKGFQGRWGEMVLANVLEHSGLEEGRWMVYQQSATNDDGRRLRPDAIINCPRNRRIIIDAKCSLNAYLQLQQAVGEDDRRRFAKAHVAAIDAHIKTLASKAYQDVVTNAETPGFVIMFMPHEGAFIAAMQTDELLWQRAFDSRIIIASPVHLVTVVKLVEQMWVSDDRGTNARRIADEASKMLEKLIAAYEDLAKVGDQIDRARDAYDAAVNKLRTGKGNVSRRIANITALGVHASKGIPHGMDATDED